jgi:pimeloyl-ACP methyl ester carboxylesterase
MRSSLLLPLIGCTIAFSCSQPDTTTMEQVTTDPATRPITPTSGYAQIGPLKMYYEVYGHGGTPLVLIHGGGSTIESNWGRVIGPLSSDRQVIAVELQAHGHTPDVPDRPTSFEQDADDVAGLLKHLKIAKADLFGFSNGGNTAMQVAIRHPELVNKLVIASAFYQREGMIPGFWDGMKGATIENMPQPLKDAFLKADPDSTHLMAMFTRDATRMIEFRDWPDSALASIQAPTLLIAAENDVMTPAHVQKMAGLIPHAEALVVSGGHGSYLGEICTPQPDTAVISSTVTRVKQFLGIVVTH